jgi:hypothetical protein
VSPPHTTPPDPATRAWPCAPTHICVCSRRASSCSTDRAVQVDCVCHTQDPPPKYTPCCPPPCHPRACPCSCTHLLVFAVGKYQAAPQAALLICCLLHGLLAAVHAHESKCIDSLSKQTLQHQTVLTVIFRWLSYCTTGSSQQPGCAAACQATGSSQMHHVTLTRWCHGI